METTCFLVIPIILTSMLIIASHRKIHTFMTTQTASKTPKKKIKAVTERNIAIKNGAHISQKKKY